MLFERSLETVRFEHLGAAEARHAVPQGERLLGDIGVVRGAIDGFMEGEIERGIGVDIASLDEGGRAFMQTGEPNALERMHAITCQADAKCFNLGSHFEHTCKPLVRKFCDDRTAPRKKLPNSIIAVSRSIESSATPAPRRGRTSTSSSMANWRNASRAGVRDVPKR